MALYTIHHILKNEKIQLKDYKYFIFCLALFSLIPLWNIPHTIAARYACEGLLLILILSSSLDWKPILSKSKLIILFFGYLFIQLFFFSTDLKIGLSGFKSEWMHFILFSFAGAGAGLIISKQKSDSVLLYIGAAFTLPLLIHLGLSIFRGFQIGAIPWGYWGINEHHGDLGYTALQGSVLLSIYFLCGTKTRSQKILTLILLLVCIASPLIAQSRGGVIFVLISILFTVVSFFLTTRDTRFLGYKQISVILIALIGIGFLVKLGVSADPARWGGSISRGLVGFYGDPASIFCNGIHGLRESLRDDGISITPAIESGIKSVEDGDGARVMVARLGLTLTLQNPMGINGSKQAYQSAVTQFCGGPPAIFMANAHNAWIDTALAIGIPGAILLLLVMLNYGAQGIRLMFLGNQVNPYAFALFISAFVWVLRGALDSSLRDQMLEMQAFVLGLLLALATKRKEINN